MVFGNMVVPRSMACGIVIPAGTKSRLTPLRAGASAGEARLADPLGSRAWMLVEVVR